MVDQAQKKKSTKPWRVFFPLRHGEQSKDGMCHTCWTKELILRSGRWTGGLEELRLQIVCSRTVRPFRQYSKVIIWHLKKQEKSQWSSSLYANPSVYPFAMYLFSGVLIVILHSIIQQRHVNPSFPSCASGNVATLESKSMYPRYILIIPACA